MWTCFTRTWYRIRPPPSAPLRSSAYAGLFLEADLPFVLSMSRQFEVCSDGTLTFHPSPPSSHRLSKTRQSAVAAMACASARV